MSSSGDGLIAHLNSRILSPSVCARETVGNGGFGQINTR